jgi:hypothetical protein
MLKTLDAETKKLLILHFWWKYYRRTRIEPVTYKGKLVPETTILEARKFLTPRITTASNLTVAVTRKWSEYGVPREQFAKMSAEYDRIKLV